MKYETKAESAIKRQFLDALRECLGLEPLYNKRTALNGLKFVHWMHGRCGPKATEGMRGRIGSSTRQS